MQAIKGHLHRRFRIRIFIRRGIERDACICRIRIVAVSAGLRVFEALILDQPPDRQPPVMIQVDAPKVFVLRNVEDRTRDLLQGLSLFSLYDPQALFI